MIFICFYIFISRQTEYQQLFEELEHCLEGMPNEALQCLGNETYINAGCNEYSTYSGELNVELDSNSVFKEITDTNPNEFSYTNQDDDYTMLNIVLNSTITQAPNHLTNDEYLCETVIPQNQLYSHNADQEHGYFPTSIGENQEPYNPFSLSDYYENTDFNGFGLNNSENTGINSVTECADSNKSTYNMHVQEPSDFGSNNCENPLGYIFSPDKIEITGLNSEINNLHLPSTPTNLDRSQLSSTTYYYDEEIYEINDLLPSLDETSRLIETENHLYLRQLMKADQLMQPMEADQLIQPMEADQLIQPMEVTKLIEADQFIQPMETDKIVKSLQLSNPIEIARPMQLNKSNKLIPQMQTMVSMITMQSIQPSQQMQTADNILSRSQIQSMLSAQSMQSMKTMLPTQPVAIYELTQLSPIMAPVLPVHPTQLNKTEQSKQDNKNTITGNLDLELIKNKGKPIKLSFDFRKINKLAAISFETLKFKIHSLREDLKKSLEPERINKYFIYNYFFEDDLKIKKEFVFLLLILPEINVLTVLYNALENKNGFVLSDKIKQNYIETVDTLIRAYKHLLRNKSVFYSKKTKRTYDDILKYFYRKLKDETYKFRNINIRVLEEIYKYNSNIRSVEISNTFFDIHCNQILKLDGIENFKFELAKKYGDKISNSRIYSVQNTDNSQEENKLDLNKKKTRFNINSENTENTKQTYYSMNNNPSLNSYINICNRKTVSNGISRYSLYIPYFFIIFLNNDWLKILSKDFTKILHLDTFDFHSKGRRVGALRNKEGSLTLHHNINLFLKILYKKYNIKLEEVILKYDYCDDKLQLLENENSDVVELSNHEYMYSALARYTEVMLYHYINQHS